MWKWVSTVGESGLGHTSSKFSVTFICRYRGPLCCSDPKTFPCSVSLHRIVLIWVIEVPSHCTDNLVIVASWPLPGAVPKGHLRMSFVFMGSRVCTCRVGCWYCGLELGNHFLRRMGWGHRWEADVCPLRRLRMWQEVFSFSPSLSPFSLKCFIHGQGKQGKRTHFPPGGGWGQGRGQGRAAFLPALLPLKPEVPAGQSGL